LSEWRKDELHWNVRPMKMLRKVSMPAQTVFCEVRDAEDEAKVLVPKHPFQATKVYILTDEKGQEQGGIVICPVHNQPVKVNIERRPPGGTKT
jgi:hypothetical protein